MKTLENKIVKWAKEKGIFEKSDPKSQCLKSCSEMGEVADAVNKGNIDEIIDGIGDVQVTLILLCEMYGLTMEQCLQSAYDVISKRKGSMINGVFVKES